MPANMSNTVSQLEDLHPTLTQQERSARAHIAFEDDPHRAALEDNPDEVKVQRRTWLAICVGQPQTFSLRVCDFH
jgi:hypothetical protein